MSTSQPAPAPTAITVSTGKTGGWGDVALLLVALLVAAMALSGSLESWWTLLLSFLRGGGAGAAGSGSGGMLAGQTSANQTPPGTAGSAAPAGTGGGTLLPGA